MSLKFVLRGLFVIVVNIGFNNFSSIKMQFQESHQINLNHLVFY